MENMMNTMNTKMTKWYVKGMMAKDAVLRKLKDRSGTALTENGLIIVIGAAVAAIALGLIVALMKGKISTGVESKIDQFFSTT